MARKCPMAAAPNASLTAWTALTKLSTYAEHSFTIEVVAHSPLETTPYEEVRSHPVRTVEYDALLQLPEALAVAALHLRYS